MIISIFKRFSLFPILFALLVFTACTNPQKDDVDCSSRLIDSLCTCAQDSLISNPTFSKKQLKQALRLTDDSLQIHRIYTKLAAVNFQLEKMDTVMDLANKVIRFFSKQQATKDIHALLAEAYNLIGNYYALQHIQDSAIHYLKETVEHCRYNDNHTYLVNATINLADSYAQKGDYVSSIASFRRALYIVDSLRLSENLRFPIYLGLGDAYYKLGDFTSSDHYYRLGEAQLEGQSLNDKALFCNNRGNYYYYNHEYEMALPWFRRARALMLPGGYQFHVNLYNANLGDIFNKLNMLDSAHYYLDKSYEYFSSMNYEMFLYYIATVKAEIAMKQRRYDLAKQWFEKYRGLTVVEPLIVSLRNLGLENYYRQTGNYRKAYQYLRENKRMDDSLRSERVKGRVAELELRFRQDTTLMRRNMMIEQQKRELQYLQQTKFFWVGICIILLLGGLFTFLYFRKKHDLARAQLIHQVTSLRLQNTRNRISPHFVFNVLNNAIIDGQTRETSLRELVKLIRRNLETSEQLCIPLEKELDFVRTYINLESKGLGDGFSLQWDLDNRVDCNSLLVPPMIVQIPVENAIKHALRGKEGPKLLGISVKPEGGGVLIGVRDNGGNHGVAPVTSGTGTGLRVIHQTIEMLNSRNEEHIRFSMDRVNGEEDPGMLVSIFIPKNFRYIL